MSFETIYLYLSSMFNAFLSFIRLPIFTYGGVSINLLQFCVAFMIVGSLIGNLVHTGNGS